MTRLSDPFIWRPVSQRGAHVLLATASVLVMGLLVEATTPSEFRDMANQGEGIIDGVADIANAAMTGNATAVIEATQSEAQKTANLATTVQDDLTLGVERTMKGENPWVDPVNETAAVDGNKSADDETNSDRSEAAANDPSSVEDQDSNAGGVMDAVMDADTVSAISTDENADVHQLTDYVDLTNVDGTKVDGTKDVYLCANLKVNNDDMFESGGEQHATIPQLLVKWDGNNWVVVPDPMPTPIVTTMMSEELMKGDGARRLLHQVAI